MGQLDQHTSKLAQRNTRGIMCMLLPLSYFHSFLTKILPRILQWYKLEKGKDNAHVKPEDHDSNTEEIEEDYEPIEDESAEGEVIQLQEEIMENNRFLQVLSAFKDDISLRSFVNLLFVWRLDSFA